MFSEIFSEYSEFRENTRLISPKWSPMYLLEVFLDIESSLLLSFEISSP